MMSDIVHRRHFKRTIGENKNKRATMTLRAKNVKMRKSPKGFARSVIIYGRANTFRFNVPASANRAAIIASTPIIPLRNFRCVPAYPFAFWVKALAFGFVSAKVIAHDDFPFGWLLCSR